MRALPQPQVPGAAGTPGGQGWGGHCSPGCTLRPQGSGGGGAGAGKADGHRCPALRSAAPASPGDAQAEGGASAQSWCGGPGWRRLLPTAAHDNRGALARRRATSYCFAVPRHAPARGRYPTETPYLRALGLVCTAQASGGDGPSGLSLTGPGMGRDAARGPVLHLRQRPSCPPCPALVQRPCHPQPPPRVCRPWAAHPAAGSGFPGAKPLSGPPGGRRPPSTRPRGVSSRVRRFLHSHTHACAHAGAPVTGAANVLVRTARPLPRNRSPSFRLRAARVLSRACAGRSRSWALGGRARGQVRPTRLGPRPRGC